MNQSAPMDMPARPAPEAAGAPDGGRLRVLYIVPPTGKFAGIERVVDEVCAEMSASHAERLDVAVLHLGSYVNHTIGARPYRSIELSTRGRLEVLRAIRRAVAAERYDLVVVPQIEATVLAYLACLGLRRRFVLHLHGNPDRERSHAKAKLLFLVMRHLVARRLAGVFGTSSAQLAAFRSRFASPAAHHWVPNPVRDFPGAASHGDERGGDIVRFVNIGRFSHQKGQDILIEAFRLLHARRRDVALTLVGFGELEAMLRERIAQAGLGGAVRIEHHPHDPSQALAASDVYVSASRWEGWSLTICEALRFGLPVVATDCDFGPREIVADDRIGRLVPSGDVAALADAMLHCCDHMEEARAHSRHRQAYIERYAVEHVAGLHAAALQAVAMEDADRRGLGRAGRRRPVVSAAARGPAS